MPLGVKGLRDILDGKYQGPLILPTSFQATLYYYIIIHQRGANVGVQFLIMDHHLYCSKIN